MKSRSKTEECGYMSFYFINTTVPMSARNNAAKYSNRTMFSNYNNMFLLFKRSNPSPK